MDQVISSLVRVKGLKDIVAVSFKRQYLAMDNQGKVFSWGNGISGEGKKTKTTVPREIPNLPRAFGIHAGDGYCTFFTAEGCYSWGKIFSRDKPTKLAPLSAASIEKSVHMDNEWIHIPWS